MTQSTSKVGHLAAAGMTKVLSGIEARVSRHASEKDALIREITEVRRAADRLLRALSGDGTAKPRARKGGGRPTGLTLSPATRRKMSLAAKRLWAQRRRNAR